jgi:hypothetical protein
MQVNIHLPKSSGRETRTGTPMGFHTERVYDGGMTAPLLNAGKPGDVGLLQ